MNVVPCPKCSAELPAKGRFCLECGCDLYQAGVRRAPLFGARSLVTLAIAVGILGALVVATRGRLVTSSRELPPEEQVVRGLTSELLALAAEGSYPEIVRRFCRPNSAEFQAIEQTLQEIVRGRGAPGLNIFRASATDDLEEAKKFVERHGTQHPDYVVGLLAALTFQDGALRATLGGAPLGTQRAEDFCAWHLGLAFHRVDARAARIAEVGWRDGPRGEPRLVAIVTYPESPTVVPGVVDPRVLPWRLMSDGAWALAFDSRLCLDEVLDLLLRVKL